MKSPTLTITVTAPVVEQIYVTPTTAITVSVALNGTLYAVTGGTGGGADLPVIQGTNDIAVPPTIGSLTLQYFYIILPTGATEYTTASASFVVPSGVDPTNSQITIAYA